MAKATKIERIDTLFQNSQALPLNRDNAMGQEAAVGIVQELLTCHGFPGLPNISNISTYGKFGAKTESSLKDFRVKFGLQTPNGVAQVDQLTLRRLAEEPAISPRASRGYLALALDIEMSGLISVLSFVTLAEGAGKFSAFNANTDKQGLSYGIIQWAQKPGRLCDIVAAFKTQEPEMFKSIFGPDGDAMITHTRKAKGGVNNSTGETLDPKFDLLRAPWQQRFLDAALNKSFQKIQVETARAAFADFIVSLRTFADKIKSERGFGFMIDLGNQHGTGGARNIYKAVVKETMTEDEALKAMADDSVRRVRAQFPPKPGQSSSNEERSTRDRREFFRTTNLLSKEEFDEN